MDLDDILGDIEERENDQGEKRADPTEKKVLIGDVEQYFGRLGVVAIKLTGSVNVGDLIEIDSGEFSIKQRISSMQIDRKDVEGAVEGDSIGIKIGAPVKEGSKVYRLNGDMGIYSEEESQNPADAPIATI